MNWTKAKTILIIMFIILNIFFVVNIIIANSNTIRDLDKNQVIKMLEYKEISIRDMNIIEPDNNIEIVFSVSLNKIDEKNLLEDGEEIVVDEDNNIVYINNNYNSQLDLSDEKVFKVQIEDLFNNIDINIKDYIIDGFQAKEGKYIINLIEKYDDVLLFNNNVVIEIENNKLKFILKRLKIASVNPVSIFKEEIKQVSIWQILLRHYNTKTEIVKIDYGMKIITPNDTENYKTAVQVWRIVENDGLTRFYKISNGDEIKENM